MNVTCPKCKTRLVLPDETLKPVGMKITCSGCGVVLTYKGKVRRPARDSSSAPGPLPPQASVSGSGSASSPGLPAQQTQQLSKSSPPNASGQTENILPEAPEPKGPAADKEQEAPKKTAAAPEISKGYTSPPAETGSRISRWKILTLALAGIFVIALAAVFFSGSRHEEVRMQAVPPAPAKPAEVEPPVQDSLPQSGPSLTPAEDSSLPDASPAVPAEMTEEKAIEMVKKSDALSKKTRVETIVDKWSTQNAGKYTVVGWQANKVDEQTYLVSYLVRDGDKTAAGFYFALDSQTGVVQDLARNKELREKYNIHYDN